MDSYNTIDGTARGEFKDKGSKFLAFAYYVTSEEQISSIIQDLKKEYYDARHHCYAWRMGADGKAWRANDDGEPSSTAGKPILGQLLSNELTDILVVVVRYFGGTKLGVPGLIRAYKESTIDVLNNSNIVTKQVEAYYCLSFPYIEMNSAMKIVKDFGLKILGQDFDNRSSLHICLPKSQMAAFEERAHKINGGDLVFEGLK